MRAGLVLAVALIACVTPYQPRGFRGGYTDFEAQPGIYYVAFEGNGFIGRPGVVRYWHQRAAEICGGPDRYAMLSTTDIGQTQIVTGSNPSTSTSTTVPVGGGVYQTNTTTNGGGPTITSIRKPAMEGYIRCVTSEDTESPLR